MYVPDREGRRQPLRYWLFTPGLQWQPRGKRYTYTVDHPYTVYGDPLFTPGLQWQPRGVKRRASQGCTNPRKLRYSFSAHYQCERTYRIFARLPGAGRVAATADPGDDDGARAEGTQTPTQCTAAPYI